MTINQSCAALLGLLLSSAVAWGQSPPPKGQGAHPGNHRSAGAQPSPGRIRSPGPPPVENGGVVVKREAWSLTDFAVGKLAGNHLPTEGGMIMADVLRLDDGFFLMYYNQLAPVPIGNNVLVASSPDGFSWSPRGVALAGSLDDQDRTRIVGGASVLRLPDGRYRMFTRCTQWVQQGARPDYHIRSAISHDGLSFRDEGVRIDNRNWDPWSPWLTVGHGRFYVLRDGSFAAIVSVERVENKPSDLALFRSADAMSWAYERTLYKGYHDPVVIRHKGRFELVAMYLRDQVMRVSSGDGLSWPKEITALNFVDPRGMVGPPGGALELEGGGHSIGDFGTASIRGELVLYSNFKLASSLGGASIAIFTEP